MRLGAKFACALVAIFLTLFASSWMILDRSVVADFRKIDDAQHAQELRRVQAGLAAWARDMAARVNDYAGWDDTRRYLLGAYPKFIADNFSSSWFSDYDVDLLLFVDGRGRVAWGRNRSPGGGAMERSDFLYDVVLSDARSSGAPADRPVTGIVWTQHGPLIYAARPATGSNGRAPPIGLVVVGRFLAADTLRQQVQLDLDFVSINAANLSDNVSAALRRIAKPGAVVTTWNEQDRQESLIALRSSNGRSIGAIYAHRSRLAATLGPRSVLLAGVLLAGAWLVAAAAVWALLRRAVTARLSRLEGHLNQQDDAPRPLAGERSNDEIGRLIAAYDAMAARLRESMALKGSPGGGWAAPENAGPMRTDFLALMSHELRTPLSAVIGYSELIEEDVRSAGLDMCAADAQKIRLSAQRLVELIEEILEISKIEKGEVAIVRETFDIITVLRDVADRAAPWTSANGNRFKVTFAPDLGSALNDGARLRQCALHVLGHVCKFTKGGEIFLRAGRVVHEGSEWLRVEIEDTGNGLSPEQVAALFDPVILATATLSGRLAGAGLGIAIAKKVMAQMGGTLVVHSVVGVGSSFVLRMPIAAAEPSANAPQPDLDADLLFA